MSNQSWYITLFNQLYFITLCFWIQSYCIIIWLLVIYNFDETAPDKSPKNLSCYRPECKIFVRGCSWGSFPLKKVLQLYVVRRLSYDKKQQCPCSKTNHTMTSLINFIKTFINCHRLPMLTKPWFSSFLFFLAHIRIMLIKRINFVN